MSSDTAEFRFGIRAALMLIVEAALLSIVAVGTLLLYVLFNAIRNRIHPPAHGQQRWRFIRTATDYYFFNLLFMDLIQALGYSLHIKWIGQGQVTPGAYCQAQGFLQQFGDVGVALTTLVIAVHTFAILFLRWRVPETKWLPLGVIALVWTFLILSTTIPWATKKDYYYPTVYWCWINPEYKRLQYGVEYGILWFVAGAGFVLYVPLFWRLRSAAQSYPEHRSVQMHIARQLLVYPIAYAIVITPMSVVRGLQFLPSHQSSPAPVVGLAGVFFALSGFFNATLYVITRPSILRSILSTFRSSGSGNPNASAGRGESGATGSQGVTPGANVLTMPEVTILSQGGEDSRSYSASTADEESQKGHQQRMEMQQLATPTVGYRL